MTKYNKQNIYPWIIVGASVVVAAIVYGIVFSFGVFVTPLREHFNASAASISTAYAVTMFVFSGFGVVAGWVVDRYGPRITTILGGIILGSALLFASQVQTIGQLYIAYGLIGVALSSAHSPMMTTVSRWFPERRGLALGILSAGVGGGPLVIAPLAAYLIQSGGWRHAEAGRTCPWGPWADH